MRLYNTEGATQVDDPEFGSFTPDANGAFNGLPDPMYAKLFGRPGWENDEQRAARLVAEQQEKLRDPATMLAELQKMTASQGELTAILANAFAAAKTAAVEPEPAAEEPAAQPVEPVALGAQDAAEPDPEDAAASDQQQPEPEGDSESEATAAEPAAKTPAKRAPRAAKKTAASS